MENPLALALMVGFIQIYGTVFQPELTSLSAMITVIFF